MKITEIRMAFESKNQKLSFVQLFILHSIADLFNFQVANGLKFLEMSRQKINLISLINRKGF